jgi:hypothetical protein
MQPGGLYWFLLLVAVAIGLDVLMFFRRGETDHPGLIQVRLSTQDCIQYDSLARPAVLAELIISHAWLLAVLATAGTIVGFASDRMDAVHFWISFPLTTASAFGLLFASRRYRSILALRPDNAIADRGPGCRGIPWGKISDFTLNRLSDGTQRLLFHRHRWIFTDYPIDAEIRCTAEQGEHLRQWITDRIATTRNSPPTQSAIIASARPE